MDIIRALAGITTTHVLVDSLFQLQLIQRRSTRLLTSTHNAAKIKVSHRNAGVFYDAGFAFQLIFTRRDKSRTRDCEVAINESGALTAKVVALVAAIFTAQFHKIIVIHSTINSCLCSIGIFLGISRKCNYF